MEKIPTNCKSNYDHSEKQKRHLLWLLFATAEDIVGIIYIITSLRVSASYLAADLAIDVLSHWAMVNGCFHPSAVANFARTRGW